MSKYLQLIKAETSYAKKMNQLSRRIFGDVARETNKSSLRVVKRMSEKPFYEEDNIVNYYPRHEEISALMLKLRYYGLYRDEHEDFKQEMERLRVLRGKSKKRTFGRKDKTGEKKVEVVS